MPLRSNGCFACRARKIRCDEARPGCRRCVTHGIPCPGYREDRDGGIEFKDLTDLTAQRARGELKRGGRGAKRESKKGRDGGGGGGRWEGKVEDGMVADWKGCSTVRDEWVSGSSPSTWALSKKSTKPPMEPATTDVDACMPLIPTPALPFKPGPTFNTFTPLPSPTLERAALYQSFISAYLPRKTIRGVQEGHFHFFQTLAAQRPSHPALQHGFDALSLVQLGSVHHAPHLLQQATRQYALALRALGRSIAQRDFLRDDEVLAAVVVLSSCELYEGIQVQGQGWSNHVAGANQLVAARGPESLQSELALLLFANMRHGVLCHALIERKAPFMARKEWRDVAWRVPLKKDQSNMFYEFGIQVPGLLERHDRLDLASETALEELDAILEDSETLERELREWFAGWEAFGAEEFGGLCKLAPITEFPTFLGLCEDDTFDMAFHFPDFLIGYLLSMYWMAMHFLRSNTQSLQKKRHQLLADWYPDPGDEVPEEELMGYVVSLCQSIPSFCEPESSATGSIGIFLPMRTAAMYFTAHGHWRLLKWVGSVRNNVFVKGLRPPSVDGKISSPPK